MAVGFQKEGKIAIITLNRPEALNSFDPDQINEFNKCLYDFNADHDLWVAIVTGSGERAFSVGADIKTTLPRIQASAHRGEMPAPRALVMASNTNQNRRLSTRELAMGSFAPSASSRGLTFGWRAMAGTRKNTVPMKVPRIMRLPASDAA